MYITEPSQLAKAESAAAEPESAGLWKIGALAKAVGVTVPAIRFRTAEGLLEVAEVTTSGYQLFAPDMVQRCERIRKRKEQRFTLAEIRNQPG